MTNQHQYVHIYTYPHAHPQAQPYIHIHTIISTHTHTNTHTHTYTHIYSYIYIQHTTYQALLVLTTLLLTLVQLPLSQGRYGARAIPNSAEHYIYDQFNQIQRNVGTSTIDNSCITLQVLYL